MGYHHNFCVDDWTVFLFHEHDPRCNPCCRRDVSDRILLCRCFRKFSRYDRSSNNPISGLTLATTVVAALTMGMSRWCPRYTGRCCSSWCRGCRMCLVGQLQARCWQDLKVGHILGGTPSKDADRRYYRRCPCRNSSCSFHCTFCTIRI